LSLFRQLFEESAGGLAGEVGPFTSTTFSLPAASAITDSFAKVPSLDLGNISAPLVVKSFDLVTCN
jgi:hypothetical protein